MDAGWPDPTPRAGEPLQADDVTRMNATPIAAFFQPRTNADVKAVLSRARAEGKNVSMRGTRHSMGGHTIAADGYVLDMMRMKSFQIDATNRTVTTQPGALWSDLIMALNRYGLSPRTMQSYSTFSVGGSLAVNAHGISTDFCGAESVLRFTLITADGTEVVCERGAKGASGELFGLALGGYGMFGVIVEVTLKVSSNVHLSHVMLQCDLASFPRVYDRLLADEDNDIEIKLARLDVTDVNSINIFVFRRDSPAGMRTISRLGPRPREMAWLQQYLYKWAVPSLKEARYAVEHQRGAAIDISDDNERNLLMYESADSLARLRSPIFTADDSFVLQEYFVPRRNFTKWCRGAKPIYAATADSAHAKIELLNTTIRFVHQDRDTILRYSKDPEGSFAFVLYFRLHRSSDGDEQLRSIHEALVCITLQLDGTFYLPYRHHYSKEDMDRAYPDAPDFFAAKQRYDPGLLFSSAWYEAYGRRFWKEPAPEPQEPVDQIREPVECPLEQSDDLAPLCQAEAVPVSERRSDSYRKLLRCPELRSQFQDLFLTKIFAVRDNRLLMGMISRAANDPNNADDLQIYEHLVALLDERPAGITEAWKQVVQLRLQKKELLRETVNIIGKLGRIGDLTGYVSIGDNGKLCTLLRDHLQLKGKVWVVHDHEESAAASGGANSKGRTSMMPAHNGIDGSEASLSAVLERGSVNPVGEFQMIDYALDDDNFLRGLEDGSADLVTMNQGLHHLPQNRLHVFLSEVRRVLRGDGIFIVREHDATDNLLPMLDLAHSVYNAVTGVSLRGERSEIRAFRPVLEWRRIIEAAGFVDTMLYEMEAGDPTVDEMMAFVKPGSQGPVHPVHTGPQQRSAGSAIPENIRVTLDNVPSIALDSLRSAVGALNKALPQLELWLQNRAQQLGGTSSSGYRLVVEKLVLQFFGPAKKIVGRFVGALDHATPNAYMDFPSFPLEELALAVQAFLAKAESPRSTLTSKQLFVAGMLKDLLTSFSGDNDPPIGSTVKGNTCSSCTDDRNSSSPVGESITAPSSFKSSRDPTADEVRRLLLRIEAIAPGLGAQLSTDEGLATAGFSRRAILAVKTQFGTLLGIDSVSTALAAKLDARAFDDFAAAVEKFREKPSTFSLTALTDPATSWFAIGMAIFGSPKMQFNTVGRMGLKYVGLGEVKSMWELAQRMRSAAHDVPSQPTASSSAVEQASLTADEASGIARLQRDLSLEEYRAQRTQRLTAQTEYVTECGELLVATVFVERAGQVVREIDCTDEAAVKLVDGTTVCVHGPPVNALLADLGFGEFHEVSGELRKPKRAYQFGDFTKGILKAGANLVAGSSEPQYRLEVRFLRTQKDKRQRDPGKFLPAVERLMEQLENAGAVDLLTCNADSSAVDPSLTFFKLSEWMQVEVIQILGESLEHTPWYRFPFIEFVRDYFKILGKNIGAVSDRHGLKAALTSSGLVTDLVPGIFMAFFFGQMALLALPLRMVLGGSYATGDSGSRRFGCRKGLVEQLVLLVPGANGKKIDWASIDSQITRPTQVIDGLYTIEVPTFKPLTTVLLRLADAIPLAEVLRISGQSEVCVKVALDGDGEHQLQELRKRAGCDIVYEYKLPFNGIGPQSRPGVFAALGVAVPFLLDILRFCNEVGVVVDQVFDFYG